MKKIWLIIIALVFIGSGELYLLSLSENPQEENLSSNPDAQTSVLSSQYNPDKKDDFQNLKADKIEVVHFHSTRQCWSCLTVGEYAKKVVEENFTEENQSGKIIFLDINVDLEENKNIVSRFQARGSSLFINVISEGEDYIEEDTAVWRLITDEGQYVDYFESKLKGYL